MNWFKKVFRQFGNEEMELNQTEEYVEEQETLQSMEQPREWKKEIESKVIYQYPKGKFRFPLIPDSDSEETVESTENKPRESRRREGKARYNSNSRKDINSSINNTIEQQRIPQRPKEHTESFSDNPSIKSSNENNFKASRPFKPSETISPIYGYHRPKIINERIEEARMVETAEKLRTQDDVFGLLQKNSKSTNKNSTSPIVEDSMLTHVQINLQDVDNYPLVEENNDNEDINIIQHKETTVLKLDNSVRSSSLFDFINEEKIDENPKLPLEEELSLAIDIENSNENDEIEYQSILTPQVVEENDKKAVDENPELLIEEEELNLASEIENSNVDDEIEYQFIGTPQVVEENDKKAVDENSELPIEEEELSLATDLETKEEDRLENQSIVVSQVAEEDYKNDVDKKAEIEDNEKIATFNSSKERNTKRGPLPFNVLMLNKDRRSLANKNIQKVERTIEVNPVSIENDFSQHQQEEDISYYAFPDIKLLNPPILMMEEDGWIDEQTRLLNETFSNFNVHAKVVNVTQGPSVTRYEVQPDPGVKVSKITNLSDDLKLSLAAKDIRIEAPIPGKHTVGIEVPNQSSRPVLLREILESSAFMDSASPLTVAMGLDISGKPIVTDLRKMPHGLIAGATGSGKSVCINTMLVSLLYKAKPEELKLLLIDPKMVELAPYNYIPHLASPVITDVKTATAALKWAVEEMERRYELLAHAGVRDITKYNQVAEEHQRYSNKLPYLVIVIDELADLMMMAPADVEEAISRIAQKARACGIHLVIATQRPSVDVITGLIKANVPTRIAFSVSSQIDSRTVIDISGAEKLLGKGDMLFLENGTSKPVRLQGTFVSDEEIDSVVSHVRNERTPEYLFEQEELLKKVQISEEEDELFFEACEFIIEQGGASTSSLQRNFKIGYNRAARLMDMMEKQGYISEARGTKPREVLITENDLMQLHENE